MYRTLIAVLATTALVPLPVLAASKAEVLQTYSEIGAAVYGDSLTSARTLRAAVGLLIEKPSPERLQMARTAWLQARVPYQQSEVFRFGNPIVDDWEGRVNAWPLDEGLIDYVDAGSGGANDENDYAALNVIANPTFTLSGRTVDAGTITPALISDVLHEADEVEANVASGYHAIEFLLWGQDLNGTGQGAGERPWTDYAQGPECSGGNCDRRAQYLLAVTDLLITDLEEMATAWAEGGAARAALMADDDRGIAAILTGMGSLSYGEQAGERMKLGLMLNDPEEEHDCFSDNTHNSHFYDGLGIRNVYVGEYIGIDGRRVAGASVSGLVAEADPAVAAALRGDLDHTMAQLTRIKTAAEAGFSYDRMLAQGSADGEALIMAAVNALVAQTRSIERAVTALGTGRISFEGSDSLDDPDAVFH